MMSQFRWLYNKTGFRWGYSHFLEGKLHYRPLFFVLPKFYPSSLIVLVILGLVDVILRVRGGPELSPLPRCWWPPLAGGVRPSRLVQTGYPLRVRVVHPDDLSYSLDHCHSLSYIP